MKTKTILLKIARFLIFRCTEFTPSETKFSDINYRIAKIDQEINGLLKRYTKK
jgi:hypothetical protein